MYRELVYEAMFVLLLMVMHAVTDLDDFLNSLLPVTMITRKVVPFSWIKSCDFQITLAKILKAQVRVTYLQLSYGSLRVYNIL